jgi:hypothetical protein
MLLTQAILKCSASELIFLSHAGHPDKVDLVSRTKLYSLYDDNYCTWVNRQSGVVARVGVRKQNAAQKKKVSRSYMDVTPCCITCSASKEFALSQVHTRTLLPGIGPDILRILSKFQIELCDTFLNSFAIFITPPCKIAAAHCVCSYDRKMHARRLHTGKAGVERRLACAMLRAIKARHPGLSQIVDQMLGLSERLPDRRNKARLRNAAHTIMKVIQCCVMAVLEDTVGRYRSCAPT